MKNYVISCCNYLHLDNDIGDEGCESLSNGLIHNAGLCEIFSSVEGSE